MKKLNLIKKEQIKDSKTVDICKEDIDMHFFEGINVTKFENGVNHQMGMRVSGEFRDKAIFLQRGYDYILGKDNEGTIILVPLIKGL